jgi:hypothetical protein
MARGSGEQVTVNSAVKAPPFKQIVWVMEAAAEY